nr:hypothetical protein [Tanacetum cinerariifolium]
MNDEIRNSKAYKEYYAIATGEATPKPKASARRTRSSSDTSITPSTTAASLRLKASAKGKQTAKASKAKSLFALSEGRGLQGTLEVEDTHVTLTLVKPDVQQESSSVSSQFVTSMLNLTLDVGMESIFETTSRIDVQTPTSVAHLPITTPTMTSSTIDTTTPTSQAPTLPTTIPSEIIQSLPSFSLLFCFDDRLRTSYAVAADLSEMELKKILIKRMEGNKSIQCSDEQKNLYKALVDAYESNKIILNTYGETVTLKRRRNDDEDKDEEPFAGPDRGSKRRKEGKEPESASAPSEIATKSIGRSTTGSRSRQASTSKSAFTEEPVQTTSQIEEPSHQKLK